ncbi:helix-turn-helix domain-containing protein [Paenibacillus sp. HWE-109]|uniref:helix-turn-helix domain-containing protein n=1 Tax=Paenibacillus sp. HWE-109 TaxID=1306526 RepID=UPI001EDF46B9|nr:helix-turn-helix transcriptional regulator [Paenibacillus sp. HWE-109]UKS29946.1 helix-turn-helix domain-containing protein [Paenibacillus sp. HWE-109]
MMSSLGDRLKQARERKNLNQIQVYERTKINNKTLSRYENGGSEPDISTLKTLASLYEVSVDWLTGQDVKQSGSNSIDRAFFGGADQYTEDELEIARAAAQAAVEAYRKGLNKKK